MLTDDSVSVLYLVSLNMRLKLALKFIDYYLYKLVFIVKDYLILYLFWLILVIKISNRNLNARFKVNNYLLYQNSLIFQNHKNVISKLHFKFQKMYFIFDFDIL